MTRVLFSILMLAGFIIAPYSRAGEMGAEENLPEEALSGQELLDECSVGAAPGAPNQYCMRYIFGLVQVVDSFQNAEPSSPKIFCIDPNQVGLPEVTERTTNWLKSVPDRLDEDAYKLVTESLHINYPCS
ncbi:MAG TPA: Rap1a/Tai family immunity protein [Gammaproteobacteria bacterium]|nr:Rap1a/Tai family immunity protein [Gammaproteobacteria bacterium]